MPGPAQRTDAQFVSDLSRGSRLCGRRQPKGVQAEEDRPSKLWAVHGGGVGWNSDRFSIGSSQAPERCEAGNLPKSAGGTPGVRLPSGSTRQQNAFPRPAFRPPRPAEATSQVVGMDLDALVNLLNPNISGLYSPTTVTSALQEPWSPVRS